MLYKQKQKNDSQQDEYIYQICSCYQLEHTKCYPIESNMNIIDQDLSQLVVVCISKYIHFEHKLHNQKNYLLNDTTPRLIVVNSLN